MEQQKLNRRSLLQYLDRLESGASDYLTVYASHSASPHSIVQAAVGYSRTSEEIKEALSTDAVCREAKRYRTGAVIFWSQTDCRDIILPPYVVTKDGLFTGEPQTPPLKKLLHRGQHSGVVLLTWGSYGIGVFREDYLIEYKTGTGYIHKRHRKGGRSERRFARRTEEQKKDFLRKVANHIEEKFRVYDLESIFFGGNRLLLPPLLEESNYLNSKADLISKRILNVRHADRETLIQSVGDINSASVFEF